MEKKSVVEYLKSLSACEFLQLIQSLALEEKFSSKDGTSTRVKKRYLLANAVYDIKDNKVIGGPDFTFFSSPEDGGIWPNTPAEAGSCLKCGTEVLGFSRHSLCPVCNHYVALS